MGPTRPPARCNPHPGNRDDNEDGDKEQDDNDDANDDDDDHDDDDDDDEARPFFPAKERAAIGTCRCRFSHSKTICGPRRQ